MVSLVHQALDGARPVRLIISVIKWIRISRLSIKNSPYQALGGWVTSSGGVLQEGDSYSGARPQVPGSAAASPQRVGRASESFFSDRQNLGAAQGGGQLKGVVPAGSSVLRKSFLESAFPHLLIPTQWASRIGLYLQIL